MNLAREPAAAGELAETVLRLRAALALEPDDAQLHGRLGLVLYRLGFEAEAAAHLKVAVRRSTAPERWRKALRRVRQDGLGDEDRLRLAEAFSALAEGRPGDALADFKELVLKAPRSAAAWLGLRGALHALGRDPAAAKAGGRWRRSWPAHRPGVEAALARPLSRRGLIFDPREPLRIRSIREVLKRVGSAEELRRTPNAYLWIDEHRLPIECSPVIPLEADGSDAMVLHRSTGRRLMARFDDALLVGVGLVVTPKGEVVSELLGSRNFRVEQRDGTLRFPPRALQDGAGEVRVFDAPGLLMAGPTDRSYGDWINQYPTRLTIAEAAGVDCPPVVRSDIGERYVDMLEALGVAPERLMRHNGFASVFPQLYVPSWPLKFRQEPMPGWFDVYRRAWAPPPAERRRIYLTRRGVDHRSLLNEPEIAEIFARRGFDIVAPEALSMGEMIKLFAGPSVVAGPYGSAVRSLVFCRQKPVVFTIMPPYDRRFIEGSGLFFAQAGVRFAWVQGEPAAEAGADHPNESPWIVDPALVADRLERLLDCLRINPEIASDSA